MAVGLVATAVEQPLVTICVPAFNAAPTIEETLRSILAQTHSNLEVIVSDNCSTDATPDIVQSIKDPRLSLVRNATNIGGEANFEKCMVLGHGKFRAIYHSDDVYEPRIVEKEVAFLEANPEAGAVSSRSSYIDGGGRFLRYHWWPRQIRGNRCVRFEEGFRLVVKYGNPVVTPSVMARAEVYRDLATWNYKDFRTSADLDVWFRVMMKHSFGFLDEPLVRYRRGPQSFGYHESRHRVAEPDFIHVLRQYMERPDVRRFLTTKDVRNFKRYERRNKAIRANIAHLTGSDDLARELLKGAINLDAVHYAVSARGGMRVLGLGLLVRADLAIPGSTRRLLEFVRERWW